MKQNKFLQELQKRATEQHIILYDVPFPKAFLFVSRICGEYPWRILIPVAVGLTILLHILVGKSFDERILWLFGAI